MSLPPVCAGTQRGFLQSLPWSYTCNCPVRLATATFAQHTAVPLPGPGSPTPLTCLALRSMSLADRCYPFFDESLIA
jgi:hypothetical protein